MVGTHPGRAKRCARQLEDLQIEAAQDLSGLKQLINQEFVILSRTSEFRDKIVQKGRERRRQRLENERQQNQTGIKPAFPRTITMPSAVNSMAAQLKQLIQRLDALKNELNLRTRILK
jgi:malate synthase